jgi:hypothetical protein
VTTVHAAIGNSDDRLTQTEWADYTRGFVVLVREHADEVFGEWFSHPTSPYQNACIGFAIEDAAAAALRTALTDLRRRFRQGSIAWAAAPSTEFL